MKSCVIDTSVVGAAFFLEAGEAAADALLTSNTILQAPDLIYVEFASAASKRMRRGDINERQSRMLLADLLNLPVQITHSNQLAAFALELAIETGRSVYDCMYLALAINEKTVMITADQRLVNGLTNSPLSKHVVSLNTIS